MAYEKAPAFQFYPRDFLSDPNVIGMTYAERGVYITLLSICWLEGSLPADLEALRRLIKGGGLSVERQRQVLTSVTDVCFLSRGDGRLYHKRLEAEREKQQCFSDLQQNRANRRWPKLVGQP